MQESSDAMAAEQVSSVGSDQPDGQTHGSPQREPRDLSGMLPSTRLAEVTERLRGEPAFETDGRNSETLLHDGTARVVVTALDRDRDVGSEMNDGYVVLMLLDGEGTLQQGQRRSGIAAGELVMLAPGGAWSFHSNQPSSFVACFWQPV